MAIARHLSSTYLLFVLFSFLFMMISIPGTNGAKVSNAYHPHGGSNLVQPKYCCLKEKDGGGESSWKWRDGNARRLMIGSMAPTCTYNECKGCRFRCRAEQVPVDANDPINSAYHYRCVCHRWFPGV